MRKKYGLTIIALAVVVGSGFILNSCAPTYPKEKLPELVREVCRIEYGMEVDVAVEGSTLGIYYPMQGLLDANMGISKDAWDKISDLILVASRVVLSTDANIQFYCVITQDERLPEMQVIIIKFIDDVKKGMFRYIGRSESFKRTLFSINLTPQARKERSVERVFDKMGLEESIRESVLTEFFRSPPSDIKDIGYWRGNFYLKDITMGEFLAAQIANRVKLDFQEDKKLSKLFKYGYSKGSYVEDEGSRSFLIQFKIFDQGKTGDLKDLRRIKIEKIVSIANDVVNSYKFKNFDFIELYDQLANIKLWVDGMNVRNYSAETMPVDDIVKTSVKYF